MTIATAEVMERHAERAAYFCIEVMHRASKAIRRQPLRQSATF
jgi:hypothetical protein